MTERKKNWIRRLADRVVSAYSAPPPPASLIVEADGFSMVWADNETHALKWADVKEIVAYKLDCFGYDLICVAFRISEEGHCFDIDEQMPGYQALLDTLPGVFPGVRAWDDWFREVAFPAFVTNATSLWRRDARDPHNWPWAKLK